MLPLERCYESRAFKKTLMSTRIHPGDVSPQFNCTELAIIEKAQIQIRNL